MNLIKCMSIMLLCLLFLTTSTLGSSDPCSGMDETECQASYLRGFFTYDNCQTSYYCFPIYAAGEYDRCKFYPRTNLANCKTSPTTCYNNIPIDASDYRRCFCGKGVEFKEIDACGNPTNWTGECLLIETCERQTKIFQGKEYEYFINCETPEYQAPITCDNLSGTRCDDSETLTYYSNIYKPNECNTACELVNTTIIGKEKCVCKNNNCIAELPEAKKESDPVFYKHDTDENQNITEIESTESINESFDHEKDKTINPLNILKIVLIIIGTFISSVFLILVHKNKKEAY